MEYLLSTDLMILNVGNKPTFVNKLREEVLDISLCSKEIFPLIHDWIVTDSILTSDHKCINFKMCLDPIPPLLFRNPEATNWEYFRQVVETELSNYPLQNRETNKN